MEVWIILVANPKWWNPEMISKKHNDDLFLMETAALKSVCSQPALHQLPSEFQGETPRTSLDVTKQKKYPLECFIQNNYPLVNEHSNGKPPFLIGDDIFKWWKIAMLNYRSVATLLSLTAKKLG